MTKTALDQAKDLIYKYGLENAINFNGKASEKSVMQKIMATHADLRKHAKAIMDMVEEIVKEINAMDFESQTQMLLEIAPELLEKKDSGERSYELPPLENAEEGKVVTRYAPEPNGEMHLGHAYTAYFAHYYAQKYKGTFILRFEDTNPKQERIKYMDAHRDALEWLGIPPDKEIIVSNDIPVLYEKAEELIKKNKAYTCSCPVDKMRELRAEMQPCEHTKKSVKETMTDWEAMKAGKYDEGELVLRLRGNMNSENAVMRDPAIFTIRKDKHCIQGTKYKVWPLYDFAVAVEDALCGITHVGRSSEFDSRIELQNTIREFLQLLPHPEIFHYARFNVIGSPASKRKIIPLVESGRVEGWDDIRLVTIKGLKKRGIVPEAIKQLLTEVGITTQPTNVDWSLISATNRKIIDNDVPRFFFVPNPVLLFIENAPTNNSCTIPLHPSNKEFGVRKVNTNKLFLISQEDYEQIKIGEEFRLKDLFNVKITRKDISQSQIFKQMPKLEEKHKNFLKNIPNACIGVFTDRELKPGPKIQWTLANPEKIIPIEVKEPGVLFIEDEYNEKSLTIVKGYGEKAINQLKVNDLAQFERYGFIRVDKKQKNKLLVNLAHK